MSTAPVQPVPESASDVPPLQVAPLLAALERHGVSYTVIGGVAAQLHGGTAPTRGLDIVPNGYGPNLALLQQTLVDVDAREYVPGFGHPLQLPMDRRRLSSTAPLHTTSRYGPFDVIPQPHGFDDGYRRIGRHARYRYAYGMMVPVADLDDLIRSHTAAGRAKDGPITARLRALDSHIRTRGLLEVHEQSSTRTSPAPRDRAEPELHAALDAAAALATVFDDVRPAMAAARRQLYQALDDTDYGEASIAMRRIQIARGAVDTAHAEITGLRRKLQPDATGQQLDEPPLLEGPAGTPTLLAYQAYDEISITRRLLADLDPRRLHTAEGRDMLIESRIHAATADANLDLLQIQLERTARAWEPPERGHHVSGPEL